MLANASFDLNKKLRETAAVALLFISVYALAINFDYRGYFCFHAYIWLMLLPASFIPILLKQHQFRKLPLYCLGLFILHSILVPNTSYYTLLFISNLVHEILLFIFT